jgi:hypothetical protein
MKNARRILATGIGLGTVLSLLFFAMFIVKFPATPVAPKSERPEGQNPPVRQKSDARPSQPGGTSRDDRLSELRRNPDETAADPPGSRGSSVATPDDAQMQELILRRLDPQKIDGLAGQISGVEKSLKQELMPIRQGIEGLIKRPWERPQATWSWELFTLLLLSLTTLVLMIFLIIRRALTAGGAAAVSEDAVRAAVSETMRPLFAELYGRMERIERLSRTLEEVHFRTADIRAEVTSISSVLANRASEKPAHAEGRPAPASPTSPVAKPQPAARPDVAQNSLGVPPAPAVRVAAPPGRVAVLDDFDRMVVRGAEQDSFLQKWQPQSVAMVNFDQRVRESGFEPELKVSSQVVGKGEEHFWFVRSGSSQQGIVLPAGRLLLHRAALRGDSAVKLFRMIFEIVPSEHLMLKRAAHAELIGDRVLIREEGLIGLPG